VREALLDFYILLLAGLLSGNQHAFRRLCDQSPPHRFSWYSSVFKQMLKLFPSSKLPLHASHAAFIKKPFLLRPQNYLYFKIIYQKIKILLAGCLSDALLSH
jgi:hypothetical protein